MISKIILVALFFPLLASANNPILKIESDINTASDELILIQNEQSLLQTQISDNKKRINEKRNELLKRLQAIRSLKTFRWGALLSLKNSALLDRNLTVLKILNSYEMGLIQELGYAHQEMQSQLSKLKKADDAIKDKIAQLQKQEVDLLELEEKEKQILKARNEESLLRFKGELIAPLKIEPFIHYGNYTESQNRFNISMKGQLYRINNENTVSAVGPGEVIFRDAIPFWGESIIIKHTGNYYSVYASVTQTKVNLHDQVRTGQNIALAKAPEFYFEFRHETIPLNPTKWLRKNSHENEHNN